jgi:hypothetical protein
MNCQAKKKKHPSFRSKLTSGDSKGEKRGVEMREKL